MTMNDSIAPIGDNKPPVTITAPTTIEANEDVRARYPDVEKRRDELLASAKDVPATFDDEETAKKVQTLLKSMTESMGAWKAHRGVEKGPWQKVADTVYAYFTNPMEQVKKAHDDIKGRYTAYQEVVKLKEQAAREAKAATERAEAARLAAEAEAARKRQEEAEKAEAEARAREEAAKAEAAAAEQRRLDAEAAAAKAKAEEARLAKEKKDREDTERRVVLDNFAILRRQANEIEQLFAKDIANTLDQTEAARLEALISPTGPMQQIGAPILRSIDLLDEIQRDMFNAIRERRRVLIAGRDKRLADFAAGEAAAERKRVEEEQAKIAAVDAERRRLELEAEEAKLTAARQARMDEEAAAAAAKAEQKKAQADVREARSDQRDAHADAKEAGKDAKLTGAIAEKTEKRADRMDRAADASDADLTRLRNEHGVVGSLSGRWHTTIVNRDDIPLERIREFLMPDAIDAAVYRFMRANQNTFKGDAVADLLPGVVFEFIPESRIK